METLRAKARQALGRGVGKLVSSAGPGLKGGFGLGNVRGSHSGLNNCLHYFVVPYCSYSIIDTIF